MENKLNVKEALKELNSIDEDDKSDDFDVRWEKEFGNTDQVIVMSAEDTIKQLKRMEEFK